MSHCRRYTTDFCRIFLCCLLLGGSSLFGQFSSAIEGTVTDSSGADVPDAKVALTNTATGVELTAQTNGAGFYRFSSLQAGTYSLKITKAGFQTAQIAQAVLESAKVSTLNIALSVGTVNEQVEVSAQSTQVDTVEPKISNLITTREIADLPITGRNIYALSALTPGVVGTGNLSGFGNGSNADSFDTISRTELFANGQRGMGNAVRVDEANVDNSANPGEIQLTPNPEMIQESRISTNNYSAEYGRGSSISTQIVTKSGTNQFHGSLYEYHQDNVLSARNVFQSTVDPTTGRALPVSRRNEFGGSFGGPVFKDRTFFFGTYAKDKEATSVSSNVQVETPDFVNFMKARYPNNISTKLLSSFPAAVGPIIPGTTQTVASLLGTSCTGTGPLGMPCNLPLVGTATHSYSNPRDGQQYNFRIDHNMRNANDRLSFNYVATESNPFADAVRRAFAGPQPTSNKFANLNFTHIFTPTIVNMATASISRIVGQTLTYNSQVPALNIPNLTTFGNGWGPGAWATNMYNWRDILSINRGSHTIKTGIDAVQDRQFVQFTPAITRASYSFLSLFDFANDAPYQQSNVSIDPRTGASGQRWQRNQHTDLGIFIQDDWQVAKNLTVNAGLRFEWMTNPHVVGNPPELTQFDFTSGANFAQRMQNVLVKPTSNFFSSLPKGLAPRIGFAWDPTKTGKMSIRSGFGLFYQAVPDGYKDLSAGNPPYVASITATTQVPSGPQPVYALGTSGTYPFGFPLPSNLGNIVGLNQNGLPNVGPVGIGAYAANLKYAYAESAFFGVQYQLGSGWIAEVDYQFSGGRRLYQQIDRNRYAGDTFIHNGTLTRLNPLYSSITYVDNTGSSSYNGGSAVLRKTFSSGNSFQVTYTLGKTIDYANGVCSNTCSIGAAVVDAYNLNRQRGLSETDIRNRIAFNFVYELPKLTHQHALVHNVLGGWELSGIGIFESGLPFPVYSTTQDFNGDGTFYDYPNAPLTKFGSWNRSNYLNGIFSASAFPTPAQTTLGGNLGRNVFRGPGFANVNSTLSKSFRIPWFWSDEAARMQIRGEFYNVFNRVNLQNVDGNLADGTFGKATSTFNPRYEQIAVRIDF